MDGVGLVELVRCGFLGTFSSQVEEGFGLGSLLTARFKPLVNLLAIIVSGFFYKGTAKPILTMVRRVFAMA